MDTIKVSVVIFFLSTSNNVENIQKRTLYFKKKEKENEGRREKRKRRENTHTPLPSHCAYRLGSKCNKTSQYLPSLAVEPPFWALLWQSRSCPCYKMFQPLFHYSHHSWWPEISMKPLAVYRPPRGLKKYIHTFNSPGNSEGACWLYSSLQETSYPTMAQPTRISQSGVICHLGNVSMKSWGSKLIINYSS